MNIYYVLLYLMICAGAQTLLLAGILVCCIPWRRSR